MMSSTGASRGGGGGGLALMDRIASEALFDSGVLSPKFRLLSGRVVYFRPFIQRRTSSGDSKFVERVIFVVGSTGELIISDTQATPKRSVALHHVTTVVVDGAVVTLLFEQSSYEHDIQLKFCPAPPSGVSGGGIISDDALGHTPSSGGAPANATMMSASIGTTTTPRVTFADDQHQQQQQTSSSSPAVVPLMSLKQFVHVVHSYSPQAQVVYGSSATMDVQLAKPNHFTAPSSLDASFPHHAAMPSPIAHEKSPLPGPPAHPPTSSSSSPPSTSAAVSHNDGGNGESNNNNNSAAGRLRFKDLTIGGASSNYTTTSNGAAASHDGGGGGGGAGIFDDMSPPSKKDSHAQLDEAKNEESAENTPSRTLRSIAAAGNYLRRSSDKNAKTGEEVFFPDDDPHQQTEMIEPLPQDNGGMMFAPVHHNSVEGEGENTIIRRMSMLRNSNAMAGDNNNNNDDDGQHLLSDMVKRLRTRRGEIQMQNLMIQGELKGMQRKVEALLNGHQHVNPMPEFDEAPIHRRKQQPHRGDADEWDSQQDDDAIPAVRLMTPSREYNRTLNLSLVVLTVCRRQRQIHLHAERDAREAHQKWIRSTGSVSTTNPNVSIGGGLFGRGSRGGGNEAAFDSISLLSMGR